MSAFRSLLYNYVLFLVLVDHVSLGYAQAAPCSKEADPAACKEERNAQSQKEETAVTPKRWTGVPEEYPLHKTHPYSTAKLPLKYPAPEPKPKPAHLRYKGRKYIAMDEKPDGEEITKEECVEHGFWIPRSKGNCWWQIVPESVKNETNYCPLPISQSRAACVFRGCTWRPHREWRCYKPPGLMERESVQPIIYKRESGETTFIPIGRLSISKEKCEGKGYIWIPLPEWNCWEEFQISFSVEIPPEVEKAYGTKLHRPAKYTPEPSPEPSPKPSTPPAEPCGYPQITKSGCKRFGCVWKKKENGNCWKKEDMKATSQIVKAT